MIGFLTDVLNLNRRKAVDHSAYCRFEGNYVVILIKSYKYRNSNQDESYPKPCTFILCVCIVVGIWIMKT